MLLVGLGPALESTLIDALRDLPLQIHSFRSLNDLTSPAPFQPCAVSLIWLDDCKLEALQLARRLTGSSEFGQVSLFLTSGGSAARLQAYECGFTDVSSTAPGEAFDTRELQAKIRAMVKTSRAAVANLQKGGLDGVSGTLKIEAISSELKLKSDVIENSLNGFDIVDEEGRFVYVNRAYARMWGFESPEEVLTTSPMDHCVDSSIPLTIISTLKKHGTCDIEFKAKRKDGSHFDVRMYSFIAWDSEGREIYPTTSIDISEQRRSTEALLSSEAHFREMVDTSPAMIWITDENSRCIYLSQRWYDFTGRTPEQDLGVGWVENVHPEDQRLTAEVYTQAISARGELRVDYRLRKSDGTYRWMIDLGYPRHSQDGEFLGYIGTVTDIHDRVLAENSLQDAQRRFFRSAKASDLGVWYCDLPFDYLEWNDEVKRHFFLPLDTRVTIATFYERIHPDDREKTRLAIEYSIANHAPYDIHYRTTDPQNPDRIKWIRAVGWTDYHDDGTPSRFDGITLDATEEFRRNEELMRARDEAERANQLKSAFLANMSHEIRTPLGAMLGFSDLLRDSKLNENERSNYLDILSRNGEQLAVIINDILDLSKVEAGHLQLEYVRTQPSKIAADVISLMQIKAKEKELVLDLEFGANLPAEVVSDPLRVRQVLINLLGNAIKFTPKGSVNLHLSSVLDGRTGKKALQFRVEDSGIGISHDQWDNVFQMFVQADGSMTRRFGGTGLGLALSRRLARALGGEVEIERSEEGVGTTFLFTILDSPERAAGVPSVSRQVKPGGELANALDGKRILVVDDAADNQRLISIYLKKAGANFDSAENGLEGYKRALAGEYDVILMDLQMPEMDGYTATQKLRDVGYLKPIIALTAHAMSEVRDKCIQVGFTDHLPKPINPTELIGTIARYSR